MKTKLLIAITLISGSTAFAADQQNQPQPPNIKLERRAAIAAKKQEAEIARGLNNLNVGNNNRRPAVRRLQFNNPGVGNQNRIIGERLLLELYAENAEPAAAMDVVDENNQ